MGMSSTVLVESAPYRTDDELEDLVRSFKSGTLPREEWTHIAHLTVALWYLVNYTTYTAAQLIRDGIRRFNGMKGIETTRTSGYHETMTLFWIWAISKYLSASKEGQTLADLANGIAERLGESGLPFKYYTRERLMSWEARTGWVEPDLKPLA